MKTPLVRTLGVLSVLWALALVPILAFAPPDARFGLIVGWAVAGLSGGLSFGLLIRAHARPFKSLMANLLGGFAARLVFVIGGLLYTVRHGGGPGWYCVSFFSLYFVFVCGEYVAVRQDQGRPEAPLHPHAHPNEAVS